MEIVSSHYRAVIFYQSLFTAVAWNGGLTKDITVKLVAAKHAVIFGCSEKALHEVSEVLMEADVLVRPVNINKNFTPENILSRHIAAKTCVILDSNCTRHRIVLNYASKYRYFNKTYHWLIVHNSGDEAHTILENVKNIGLNSQLIYANQTSEGTFLLFDVYSKGLHLGGPLEICRIAEWSNESGLMLLNNLEHVQGLPYRGQFSGLKLRGVTVIDRDNIKSCQVDALLSELSKSDGISSFVKYHYSLIKLLQHRLNFTVEYRITRGWAGRLQPSTYRLGLLGVVQRNEADIVASGAFNRINRFAEFDTIHQSWKFEAAFLFRFTAELKTHSNGFATNFLAPFDTIVWIFAATIILLVGFIWKVMNNLQKRYTFYGGEHQKFGTIFIAIFAAISQQGLEPSPKQIIFRIIFFVLLFFTLIMYNFYTSSVVGGLLSTQMQGPQNLEEIIQSPLTLTFEDIGYNKLIFKESNRSVVKKMYQEKVLPKRKTNMLPIYTHIKKAIPYLKTGSYALHCEMIDAYAEIAKHFDPNEICDLRTLSGLFETEIMNMIVTKRSQYTEIFKIVLHRAREVGLIIHQLRNHRSEKPKCQASSTIHPVTLYNITSVYLLLIGGMIMALLTLVVEVIIYKYKKKRNGILTVRNFFGDK